MVYLMAVRQQDSGNARERETPAFITPLGKSSDSLSRERQPPPNSVARARQASRTLAGPRRALLCQWRRSGCQSLFPGAASLSHSPPRLGQARKSSIFLGHSHPEAAITARNRLEPRSGRGPIEPLALDVVVITSPRPAGNQGTPLVVSSNALPVPLPFVYILRRYVEITKSGHVHHGLDPRQPSSYSRSSQPSLVPGLRS